MKVKVKVRRTVIEQAEVVVDFKALEIEPISTPTGGDNTWKDNLADQIEDKNSKPDLDQLLVNKQWIRVEVKEDWPMIDPASVEVVE